MQQITKNILNNNLTNTFQYYFSCFMYQNYTLFKDFYIKLMKSYQILSILKYILKKKNLGKAFFLSLDLRKTIFPRFDALYGTFLGGGYLWIEYPKTKTHLTSRRIKD